MNDRRQSNSVFEHAVLTELGNIKVLCEHNKVETGAVKDRVTAIEGKNKSDDWRHWITVVILSPLMLVGHSFARHMGWDI